MADPIVTIEVSLSEEDFKEFAEISKRWDREDFVTFFLECAREGMYTYKHVSDYFDRH